MSDRTLFVRKEAAEYLRLSDKTLARWAWAGKGPAFIKAGGKVLYDLADLDDWLRAQRHRSTSDPGNDEALARTSHDDAGAARR